MICARAPYRLRLGWARQGIEIGKKKKKKKTHIPCRFSSCLSAFPPSGPSSRRVSRNVAYKDTARKVSRSEMLIRSAHSRPAFLVVWCASMRPVIALISGGKHQREVFHLTSGLSHKSSRALHVKSPSCPAHLLPSDLNGVDRIQISGFATANRLWQLIASSMSSKGGGDSEQQLVAVLQSREPAGLHSSAVRLS